MSTTTYASEQTTEIVAGGDGGKYVGLTTDGDVLRFNFDYSAETMELVRKNLANLTATFSTQDAMWDIRQIETLDFTNGSLNVATGHFTPDEPQTDPVVVSVTHSPSTIEGGILSFTISLSEASTEPVTVYYRTRSPNETFGSPNVDYVALNTADGPYREHTFLPGQTTFTVEVQTLEDSFVEGTENVGFAVGVVSGNAVLDPDQYFTNGTVHEVRSTGTIIDDDQPPTPVISFVEPEFPLEVTEGAIVHLWFARSSGAGELNVTVNIGGVEYPLQFTGTDGMAKIDYEVPKDGIPESPNWFDPDSWGSFSVEIVDGAAYDVGSEPYEVTVRGDGDRTIWTAPTVVEDTGIHWIDLTPGSITGEIVDFDVPGIAEPGWMPAGYTVVGDQLRIDTNDIGYDTDPSMPGSDGEFYNYFTYGVKQADGSIIYMGVNSTLDLIA